MTDPTTRYFDFMARFREEQIAEGKLPAEDPKAAWRRIIDELIDKGELPPRGNCQEIHPRDA